MLCVTPLRQRGFSAIELLITIAVVGILVSLAAPSFTELRVSAIERGALSELRLALAYARSEAGKRNQHVAVCATADQVTCLTAGTNWGGGWLVYVDVNRNGLMDTTTEPMLRVTPALAKPMVLYGTNGLETQLRFTGYGNRLGSGGLILCRESLDPGPATLIDINSTGRDSLSAVEVDVCQQPTT